MSAGIGGGKCICVLGKRVKVWVVPGERKQPGEGTGAGDRGGKSCRANPGLNCKVPRSSGCLHRQPRGPGLFSLQCWQTKSRRDKQLPAPGMNLPPSQLLASLFSLEELFFGGVFPCFAARRTGGNGWGSDELQMFPPPPMPFISTLLHIIGEN